MVIDNACLTFYWLWTEGSDIFSKRLSSRKWGDIFWNRGYRHLCTLVMKVEENFTYSEPVCFPIFLSSSKIAFKRSLDLCFHPSIIEFRIEEKIQSKAVVNMSTVTGGRLHVFLGEIGRGLVGIYCL